MALGIVLLLIALGINILSQFLKAHFDRELGHEDDNVQNHAILLANNISLHRKQSCLLMDISLGIKAGKTTVIMGHNGAGKTLLLSALHGLAPITNGTITSTAKTSQKMVFQKPILLRRSAKFYLCQRHQRTAPHS